MRLKLQTPEKTHVDCEVRKVKAEALDGAFCLLPRHIDIVAPLAPGLLSYDSADGGETLAVDTGVLVKEGDLVLVSSMRVVRGEDIDSLDAAVRETFEVLDEREKRARSALARLEASFATRLLQTQERD